MPFVIMKGDKYLCHKGHYCRPYYESDDLSKARIFKSKKGAILSNANICEYIDNPAYAKWYDKSVEDRNWSSRPSFRKIVGLKEGYSIIEITLYAQR